MNEEVHAKNMRTQKVTHGHGGSSHVHAKLPAICLRSAIAHLTRSEKLIDTDCSPPDLTVTSRKKKTTDCSQKTREILHALAVRGLAYQDRAENF